MPPRRRALPLLFFAALLAPGVAAAQTGSPSPNPQRRRRRAAPQGGGRAGAGQQAPRQRAASTAAPPPIDRPGRAGGDLAPVPDRRYPTRAQAQDPRTQVIPAVPSGREQTRGSSFLDRDPNPEALGRRRDSLMPEPGLSVRVPFP